MENDYWFRQKIFGYGTGLPLNWKGWVHFTVLVVGIAGGNFLIQRYLPPNERAIAMVIGIFVFVVPMIWLAWRKTEGG